MVRPNYDPKAGTTRMRAMEPQFSPLPITRIFSFWDRRCLTSLRQTTSSVVTRELQTTRPLSTRAQKLRRVLQHILCVDYDVQSDNRSGYIDTRFFELAARIRDLSNLPKSYSHPRRDNLTNYIKLHIQDPATELGLPTDVAMAMLVRLSLYLDPEMKYNGCHQALFEREATGYRELVEKVTMDKYVTVFAVVFPEREELRWHLRSRIDEVLESYGREQMRKERREGAVREVVDGSVREKAEADAARVARRIQRNPLEPISTLESPSLRDRLCEACRKVFVSDAFSGDVGERAISSPDEKAQADAEEDVESDVDSDDGLWYEARVASPAGSKSAVDN